MKPRFKQIFLTSGRKLELITTKEYAIAEELTKQLAGVDLNIEGTVLFLQKGNRLQTCHDSYFYSHFIKSIGYLFTKKKSENLFYCENDRLRTFLNSRIAFKRRQKKNRSARLKRASNQNGVKHIHLHNGKCKISDG